MSQAVPEGHFSAPSAIEADLARAPESIQALVHALTEKVLSQGLEIARLREGQGINSSNSSKPPSSDGPEVPKPTRPPSDRKQGGQPGHPKNEHPLVEHPDKVVDLHPEKCECGATLCGEDSGLELHQVHGTGTVVVTVEYRRHSRVCPKCGKTTKAPLPEGVPSGNYDLSVIATNAQKAGEFQMSRRDVVEEMGQNGLAISGATVCKHNEITAAALEKPYNELAENVFSVPVLHADETSWREKWRRGWMWLTATGDFSLYLIADSRSSSVARKLLEGFTGILCTDRYSGYAWVDAAHRQLCWAHILRNTKRLLGWGEESARIGEALLRQIGRLFRWDRWVREGLRDHAWLHKNIHAIKRAVRRILEDGMRCPHAKTARFCETLLKSFPSLWIFADDSRVDPTNNLAERQLRRGVMLRKTSLGTQSDEGSRFTERILTVVETLKQQGRNVHEFIVACLRAYFYGEPYPSLLPVAA